MKETLTFSRRKVVTALLGLPVAWGVSLAAQHVPGVGEKNDEPLPGRLGKARIKAFCIDFNWAGSGVFAAPGQWADADPAAHVAWYHAAGVNTIQTFCVSCNGYAWYKGGHIPSQPGLKHNFLSDVAQQGHDRGQQVMGYFCASENTRWAKLHPENSYDVNSTHVGNIVFTRRYLDYLDSAITEALHKTSIDGFMVDELWTPRGALKWLRCEQEMYQDFYGRPFPGKEKITPEEDLDFRRRSIARCWTRIHSVVKREKPQTIIWLSSDTPNSPTIANSIVFQQVDWLMDENPNPKTWQGHGKIGPQTKLLQCVVGWGAADNAREILQHPVLGIKDFYGFSKPGTNSLPLPVPTYLQRPIDSFQGNDKNIATLVRYYNNLPFDYIKK